MILADFACLTAEDIQACLAYAADRERHWLAAADIEVAPRSQRDAINQLEADPGLAVPVIQAGRFQQSSAGAPFSR